MLLNTSRQEADADQDHFDYRQIRSLECTASLCRSYSPVSATSTRARPTQRPLQWSTRPTHFDLRMGGKKLLASTPRRHLRNPEAHEWLAF